MGYKAAAQVLKQSEDLKNKIMGKSDLLNDCQAWTDQQKLLTIYHQVLVLDLEYALDKKVEQDLWNIGFKTHISTLQELVRDKKNPKRSDCQALLTWCLEAASGFYITLLQELCNMYDLDLPFRRRGIMYGQSRDVSCNDSTNMPQSSSCLYICQYCLVHLGDIARYRNQRKQAESFYHQAIQVSPTSGHPYNQLALLEASQGDKLSTVFYYVRGIAVKNPFPASVTNLASTLNSILDKESYLQKIQTKMSSSEFIQLFLCTHEHIHSVSDLEQAEMGVKSLNMAMTALVATQSFTLDKLISMTVINLYALKHIVGMNSVKTEDLTEDEVKAKQLVLELLAASLSAFLVPVHTLKMEEKTLLEYYALPAVKLLIYWIKQDSSVLNTSVFTSRLQIWPSLCKLLNNVQKYLKDFNYHKYVKIPLSEDRNLQGFLPLAEEFQSLDFKLEVDDPKTEQLIRIKRILEFGMWLTTLDVGGRKLITQSKIEETKEINFEPSCVQPDPTNDLLEEMKSVNTGYRNDDQGKKFPERKGGILKPQGSLEKSREEREMMSSVDLNKSSVNNTTVNGNKIEIAKMKRAKQNVALQSIFKKMEENKQVKFSMEESNKEKDKDKSVKFDSKSSAKPGNTVTSSLRTQSFNQNHPAFPASTTKQDYLNNLRNMTNLSMDKGTTSLYGQNDTSPKNNSNTSMMPYHAAQSMFTQNLQPNIPKNTLNNFNSNIQHSFSTLNFNPQVPPPNFPNLNHQSHQFSMWKPDETSIQGPPWWQNVNNPMPPTHPVMNMNRNNMPSTQNSLNTVHNMQSNHSTVPQNHLGLSSSQSSSHTGLSLANLPPSHPSMPQNHPQMPSNYSQLTSKNPAMTTNLPMPPSPGYQSIDRFPSSSHLFPSNVGSNIGNNLPFMPNNPVTKSQSSTEIFSSPWSAFSRANFMGDGNSMSYDNNRAMSMRQAMLKETSNVPGDMGPPLNRPPQNEKFLQSQPNPSGYSLFNTNSWTPNLAGQLRNVGTSDNTLTHLQQQSLFAGQGPQSLAQLLEQQNKMKNNDS